MTQITTPKAAARRRAHAKLIGKIGWHMGSRFRVTAIGKVGSAHVARCAFTDTSKPKPRQFWIEYMSVSKIREEKCFDYREDGTFKYDPPKGIW